MVQQNKSKAMSLTVTDGLTVTVLPNADHEFLMTTKEVAKGYDTSIYVVNMSRLRHEEELIEGKHFVTGVTKCYSELKSLNVPHNAVLWTKRGIVRLGFFIKSQRARMFRDWAEELIIRVEEKQRQLFEAEVKNPARQLKPRRNHNRLTQERLANILADVCYIDDKDLRLRITNKLMGGR